MIIFLLSEYIKNKCYSGGVVVEYTYFSYFIHKVLGSTILSRVIPLVSAIIICILFTPVFCSGIPGNVVSSFPTSSQTTEPQGVEYINGYLYIAKGENPYRKIYKYDTQGNFIQEINTSNSCPRELTWDGSYLWHPDTCNHRILKINLSGSTIQSFNSPYPSPCAIAWDGSYLWVSFPGQGNKIYKMDTSGNLTGVFITTPTNGYPSGLVYVQGYFWVSSCTDNKIYQIDTSGNVIRSFNAPGTEPAGLAFDGVYLWHADSGTDRVYKIDLFLSEHGTGIVDFDGDRKTDIAFWRSSNGYWYIINSSNGTPTYTQWGTGGDIPVVGDWNGSGTAKIGVYRQSTGTWYLDFNGNRAWDGPPVDAVIGWGGDPNDIPVVGDWNGSGSTKIGVYRQSTGTWYLDLNGNRAWDGSPVDAVIDWGGDPNDIPVVGDWNGSGSTKIGVYRQSTGTWYLDLNGNRAWDGPPVDAVIGWGGDPNDIAVVGDWNGSGSTKIGVYRQSTGTWYLDLNGNRAWDGPPVDAVIGWGGDPNDIPVVGDWNSSGTAKIGVYRKSTGTWYLDFNGNRAWDGPPVDAVIGWGGDQTDIPVSGVQVHMPAEVKFAPTTRVLDNVTIANLSSISEDGAKLLFSAGTPQLDSLNIGEIIISGVTAVTPRGMLRKVVGVEQRLDGSVEVTTEPASLEDAFEELHIKGTIPSEAATQSSLQQVPMTGPMAEEAASSIPKITYKLPFTNFNVSGSYDATLSSDYSFNPSLEYEIDISWSGLKKLKLVFKGDQKWDLNAELATKVAGSWSPEWAPPIPCYIFVLPAGPLIITIEFIPSFGAELAFQSPTALDFGFTASNNLTTGFEISNGTFSPIGSSDSSLDAHYSLENATFSFKPYFRGRLGFYFFGALGPYIDLRPYGKVSLTIFPELEADLGYGLNMNLGGEFKVFSWTWKDIHYELFDQYWSLFHVTPPVISGSVRNAGGIELSGVTVNLTGTNGISTTNVTDAHGNYSFIVKQNETYIITPMLAGYTFNPPNRTVDVFGANVMGQDFIALGPPVFSSDFTGKWSGTWTSSLPFAGDSGSVSANLTQTGTTLTGTLSVTNTDCGNFNNLPVTGSVSNNVASFHCATTCPLDGSYNQFQFTYGAISGNTMTGNYTIYSNGAFLGSGTFTVNRPPPTL